MIDDKYRIGIQEAIKLTGKSESTIRRLIRKGYIESDKVKEGRYFKIYLNRNELLDVISKQFSNPVKLDNGQSSVLKVVPDSVKLLEHHSKYLEDQILELKERNRILEERGLDLEKKIERLNEEIKALLRQGQDKRRHRGIVGYLVERITS